MVPFIASQIQATIEGIRLLETVVTAPLGLYSDIRMLRESLPFPEAAELSTEETRDRRTSFMTLTDAPHDLALGTISSLGCSIDILEAVKDDPDVSRLRAGWVDQARQVLGRAERRVAGEIRAATADRISGLYVVVDAEATGGRPVLEVAQAALEGGAGVLQLRDKIHEKGEVLKTARQLKSLCDEHHALFVINGDADLALSSDAGGLHVDHNGLPVSEARRVLLPRQLVGRSTHTVDEAVDAQAQGVDYVSVGPIYATATATKTDMPGIGVEALTKVKGLVLQPVVAVGGIDAEHTVQVVSAGADCVCVDSAVTLADNPESAAAALVHAIEKAG